MRNETKVFKWGNSLAVRIPQRLAKQGRISEGDLLDLALQRDDTMVLGSVRPRYELSELVSKITAKNQHGEIRWG